MRYNVTRLCGGKALMTSPREIFGIDMEDAKRILSDIGDVRTSDDMMIIMMWKDMAVTVYPQGKIMFHPLDDRELAISYANEILGALIK